MTACTLVVLATIGCADKASAPPVDKSAAPPADRSVRFRVSIVALQLPVVP
jgi:hypothetical protein